MRAKVFLRKPPANVVAWIVKKAKTHVKYTASSGLPDWEGVIVGELAYDLIPNKSHIVEVEIGSLVTSLGNGAFSGCGGLKSVTIPDSMTSIGGSAFSWCSKLTSATIPDSVRSIGREAFYNCSRLTRVTIGNSVTSIGYQAFYNCSGLTSVTIPDSVTSISGNAFYGCSSLKTVEFEGNAPAVGTSAFANVATGCKAVISPTATGFPAAGETWNGLIVEVKST